MGILPSAVRSIRSVQGFKQALKAIFISFGIMPYDPILVQCLRCLIFIFTGYTVCYLLVLVSFYQRLGIRI